MFIFCVHFFVSIELAGWLSLRQHIQSRIIDAKKFSAGNGGVCKKFAIKTPFCIEFVSTLLLNLRLIDKKKQIVMSTVNKKHVLLQTKNKKKEAKENEKNWKKTHGTKVRIR